jgi:hypothetical protein
MMGRPGRRRSSPRGLWSECSRGGSERRYRPPHGADRDALPRSGGGRRIR